MGGRLLARNRPMRMPGSPSQHLAARRLALAVGLVLCAVLAGTGCKSGAAGSRAGGGLASRGDPLLGHRIPPQNLPVPGRDGGLAGRRRDPLLGFPSDEPRNTDQAGKTGNNDSATLPPRSREPYQPGRATTNAALAGGLRPDDSDLSIGDRRPPGTTTSVPRGPVPFRADDYAQVAEELRRLGAKLGEPNREGELFVVRGEVPLDPAQPGRLRWYEGAGPTAAAAAKQVLDQVKSDRNSR